MGVLRQTIQREVHDILDTSIFTSDDFVIKFGDHSKNEYMIFIQFKCDPKYTFAVEKFTTFVKIIRTPGIFEEKESSNFNHIDDALMEIHGWCKEIRNELKASQPLYSEVDQLRKIVEEHLNSGSSSEEFSPEDIYSLRRKFEDLESRVINLENDKIVTETQLKEFVSGMKQIKDDLEFYPKKTWVRTASNKLVHIITSIGKSPEGRELISDGARKLLGM